MEHRGSIRYRGLHSTRRPEQRVRLYPRCALVLRKIVHSAAVLQWCPNEGKYRVDGRPGRESVVIQRTLSKLLRLRAIEAVGRDYTISAKGRALLAQYDSDHAQIRREMRRKKVDGRNETIRTCIPRFAARSLVWTGENFGALDELLDDAYSLRYDRDLGRVVPVVAGDVLQAGLYIVADRGEVKLMSLEAFSGEYRFEDAA